MAAGVEQWVAIGGLGVTVFGGIAAGVVHSIKTAFKFGQLSEQLAQRGRDIERLEGELHSGAEKGRAADLAVALITQTLDGIGKKLDEVGTDVKNLMTGRVKPGRAGDGQ